MLLKRAAAVFPRPAASPEYAVEGIIRAGGSRNQIYRQLYSLSPVLDFVMPVNAFARKLPTWPANKGSRLLLAEHTTDPSRTEEKRFLREPASDF
jgi:hypothetical protein